MKQFGETDGTERAAASILNNILEAVKVNKIDYARSYSIPPSQYAKYKSKHFFFLGVFMKVPLNDKVRKKEKKKSFQRAFKPQKTRSR